MWIWVEKRYRYSSTVQDPFWFLLNLINKSTLQSLYHKIHLHVNGILNQNKQIYLNEDQCLFSLHADIGQCIKRYHYQNASQNPAAAALTKNKRKLKTHTYFCCWWWWWCHYLDLRPPPYVTNFGYHNPHSL